MDKVHELMFSVWQDEVGNGKAEHNHCNLYTSFLNSLGIYLPNVFTLDYAYNPDFLDSAFTVPLFELCLGQFPQRFFPELLGMTLQLEWEVLGLNPTIKLLQYFKMDYHFYELHVGIDNAASGHGAMAKEAVMLYLDQVLNSLGEEAMQATWKRIWNGYVAFGNLGTLGADMTKIITNPPSLKDQMIALVVKKAPYGQRNHMDKTLEGQKINELFGNPAHFLEVLISSKMVTPGDPDNSRIFQKMSFDGPMYEVFTEEEQVLWRHWIRSLTEKPPPVTLLAARPPARVWGKGWLH